MALKTREQVRMNRAWTVLGTRFGDDPTKWKKKVKQEDKYLSRCKSAPALIHSSGVGQTLAFLRSRGSEPGKNLALDIETIVKQVLHLNTSSLIGQLPSMNSGMYCAVTEEAIEACSWLALYLQGEGVRAEGEPEDGSEKDPAMSTPPANFAQATYDARIALHEDVSDLIKKACES